MDVFLTLLLVFVSILMILVILLQRGRGGGLVGALSGLGGQSAFGTKAGDTFTRITIVIAAIWVCLAGITGQVYRDNAGKFRSEDEKVDVKSDIQATTKDGKSLPPAKNETDDGEKSDAGEATKSGAAADGKQSGEKESASSSEESTKKDSPKADKVEKPETPAESPQEPVKKETEAKPESSEK